MNKFKLFMYVKNKMDWEKFIWIAFAIICMILIILLCYIGHEKKINQILENRKKNKIKPSVQFEI